jgi:hypothetical protein
MGMCPQSNTFSYLYLNRTARKNPALVPFGGSSGNFGERAGDITGLSVLLIEMAIAIGIEIGIEISIAIEIRIEIEIPLKIRIATINRLMKQNFKSLTF